MAFGKAGIMTSCQNHLLLNTCALFSPTIRPMGLSVGWSRVMDIAAGCVRASLQGTPPRLGMFFSGSMARFTGHTELRGKCSTGMSLKGFSIMSTATAVTIASKISDLVRYLGTRRMCEFLTETTQQVISELNGSEKQSFRRAYVLEASGTRSACLKRPSKHTLPTSKQSENCIQTGRCKFPSGGGK